MSLTELLNRSVTIVSRSDSDQEDDYGNPVATETSTETVGELQQRQRDEPGAQGEFSETAWLLILPAATVIDTGDAVVIDGEVYELVGDPWVARNPRTHTVSHIEATLRRTAGEGSGS